MEALGKAGSRQNLFGRVSHPPASPRLAKTPPPRCGTGGTAGTPGTPLPALRHAWSAAPGRGAPVPPDPSSRGAGPPPNPPPAPGRAAAPPRSGPQRRLAPSFAWSRCQKQMQSEAFVCNNCAALNYGFNKIKLNIFYLLFFLRATSKPRALSKGSWEV